MTYVMYSSLDWVRQTVHSIIANMTRDANPEHFSADSGLILGAPPSEASPGITPHHSHAIPGNPSAEVTAVPAGDDQLAAAIARLPWMRLELGSRVVVRYRLEDGLHDALGTLLEKAPTHVMIDTRRGRVTVDARTMVTGKQVPPPPQI